MKKDLHENADLFLYAIFHWHTAGVEKQMMPTLLSITVL